MSNRLTTSRNSQTYDNVFSLNTTDGTAMLLTVAANIHYTPNADGTIQLRGFGRMTFGTSAPQYEYLTYGDYVTEFEAIYPSGKVSVDVFELGSSGHN